MRLIAVDPGANHPACAEFLDGVLVRSGRVKLPRTLVRYDPLDRARCIAGFVNNDYNLIEANEVVIELPQVYARSKSKGDPNDLILLAAVCGAIAARCMHAKVTCYRPRQWAGNVPKTTTGDPWKSPRGQRIWSRLSASERAATSNDHDSTDSVGIGLFRLGRLAPRVVLPGALP